MNFKLPEARRERMEQLLEYLGDTSRYSEYYAGNRAEDFKKCFDIESEWCWKYADLMLRGMEKRELEYGERHHIVPMAWYRKSGFNCYPFNLTVWEGNGTVLSFAEHLVAHYFLAKCSLNFMVGKMCAAFNHMYCFKNRGTHIILPEERELLDVISKCELNDIRLKISSVATVEEEGRTHYWEDPVIAKKQTSKKYRDAHKQERSEYNKQYNAEHKKEKFEHFHKKWFENHDENLKKQREHRKNNKEKDKGYKQKWIMNNPEKERECHKKWARNNPEKVKKAKKRRYDKKIANGYRYRKDATTGKYKWVFIGIDAPRPHKYATKELEHEARKKQGLDYYYRKKAAGYKNVRNPITKKLEWVFVGLPVQEVAA